jgi:hypothetical protein
MNKLDMNWIRKNGVMFEKISYMNQGNADCKMCSSLICMQYAWQNLRGIKTYFNHFSEYEKVREYPDTEFVSPNDWQSLPFVEDVSGEKIKFGVLKKFRNQEDLDILTRNIQNKLKGGIPVYFGLRFGEWDIKKISNNLFEFIIRNKRKIGGHASVICGYDEDFFYISNPWNDEDVFRMKKENILKIAGGFKYYNFSY